MVDLTSYLVTGTNNDAKQVSVTRWNTLLAAIQNGINGGAAGLIGIPTRAALAALTPSNGDMALLTEAGREGLFKFSSSNLSAAVTLDTLQGMYVPPASATSGASGAWVRDGDVIGPAMFGAQTAYREGNRNTGVPPYRETLTSGGTAGVNDCTAAVQAVFTMVAYHQTRALVGDFSDGIWGIASTVTINQQSDTPRTFIGGDFRGIGSGTNLFYVDEAGYSHFEGEWHIRSAADQGTSLGYSARTWENGLYIRNSAQSYWDCVKLSGFKRWGIELDPEFNLSDYNNNIGLRFGRVYANNCGSALDRSGNDFTLGYTASSRTGSSNSDNQRTVLTMAAGHEILRVWDIIRDAAGNYHIIMEKSGADISVWPWLISTSGTGTIYSSHGGAVRMHGKDVAGSGVDMLSSVACGVALDLMNCLHGTNFGSVIQEGGGIGTVTGTPTGVSLGHDIQHMHSEGVELDLLCVYGSNVGLRIGSCSAWAAQQFEEPFAYVQTLTGNDGTTWNDAAGLPQVSLFLNGITYESGSTYGATTTTKSRAFFPRLSNDIQFNRMRKVQAAGLATSVELKYTEGVDRSLRDSFAARLEVVGHAGGAPSEAITVTLNATDVSNGIQFLNGTTSSTYVVAAGAAIGPVVLEFWLDTSGSTLRWIAMERSGITATSIADDSVTFAKMQNIATDRLLGRDTAGTGDPQEISVGGGIEWTGSGGIQTGAFTGDVTKPAAGTALTIANDAVVTAKIANDNVTFAKIQNASAASKILGRGSAGGAGDFEELSIGTGLAISSTTLSAVGSSVSTQTGTSYTAVLGDANTYVRFTNGSAVSFTIPPNSSVAFATGTVIEMEQAGAGALSVVAGSGVTINSRGADLTLAGQYSVAAVKKVATDTWTLVGDL